MGKSLLFFSLFMAAVMAFAMPAYADCLNPAGTAGKQVYNSTHNVMQFCNGTNWISMADTGVGSDTLSTLSCSDGQVAEWDNGGSAWVCATPSVPAETDPKVGTLTNTKWCTTDGTTIDCTTDAPVTTESDPKVGTLTNTKWCSTDGSTVNCTEDAPAGADNLGDHTATQAIDVGNFGLTGSNRFDINTNLATGVLDSDGLNTPYSRIEADSFHTNGIGDGQLYLEGYAIDSNSSIRIGTGIAGGQSASNVIFGGELDMGSHKITSVTDPTAAQDAATKAYVDAEVAGGGDDLGDHTATGNLDMGSNRIVSLADPTFPQNAATKAYVDAEISGYTESDPKINTLNSNEWCKSNGAGTAIVCNQTAPVTSEDDPEVNTLTGGKWCKANGAGTMINCTADDPTDDLGNHTATGNLNMGSNRITNLADPGGAQHAATKSYVDGLLGGGVGAKGVKIFISNGTYTRGAGVSSVLVIAQAPGGGGGDGREHSSGGGNGGSGSPGETRFGAFSPGATVAVTVGSPGDNGGGSAGNAGDTIFGSHLTAEGGGGGSNGNSSSNGSNGSTPTGSGGTLMPLATMFSNYGAGGAGGKGDEDSHSNGNDGAQGFLIVIEF